MSEPAISRKSALRRIVVLALACYWLAAFIATHVPVPSIEGLPEQSDKVVHFVMYAGLSFLLGLSFLVSRPLERRNYVTIFGILLVYAVADELLQIPVNRHADVIDAITDLCGAVFGLILIHFTGARVLRFCSKSAN